MWIHYVRYYVERERGRERPGRESLRTAPQQAARRGAKGQGPRSTQPSSHLPGICQSHENKRKYECKEKDQKKNQQSKTENKPPANYSTACTLEANRVTGRVKLTQVAG